jgi:hypothetical protein
MSAAPSIPAISLVLMLSVEGSSAWHARSKPDR